MPLTYTFANLYQCAHLPTFVRLRDITLATYNMFAVRMGLEPMTSGVTGRHSKPAELTHQVKNKFDSG